jgi:hypothetical protein
MANTQANRPEPAKLDKTPEQALKDDWKTKHTYLGQYITATGQIRSGLKPSDKAKAQEILAGYGF